MNTYIIHYYLNEWGMWETITKKANTKKEALDKWHHNLCYAGWSVKRSTMWAEKII